VDLLLLDIWTPMALPALEVVLPRFRRGSVVVTDNTISSKQGYESFLRFLHDPKNGFRTLTLPFDGGLELSMYDP